MCRQLLDQYMPITKTLWARLEDRLEGAVPDEVIEFLQRQRLEEDFASAPDGETRDSAVERAVELVGDLRSSGLVSDDEAIPIGSDDLRWTLIAELQEAIARQRGRPVGRWEPITIDDRKRAMPNPLHLSRVRFSVDSGMSRQGLLKAIGDIYPVLRESGRVRRTRPPGERAIAVVRFVCLERERDETWRERFDAWNAAHPEWSFASARAFHGAFRRAEMQLTGERRGLAWFYDEEVRLNYMSVGELMAEGRRGNQKAIERGLSMARAASNPADYRIFAEMDRTKDDEAKSATEE